MRYLFLINRNHPWLRNRTNHDNWCRSNVSSKPKWNNYKKKNLSKFQRGNLLLARPRIRSVTHLVSTTIFVWMVAGMSVQQHYSFTDRYNRACQHDSLAVRQNDHFCYASLCTLNMFVAMRFINIFRSVHEGQARGEREK